jgi:hypothetical protein
MTFLSNRDRRRFSYINKEMRTLLQDNEMILYDKFNKASLLRYVQDFEFREVSTVTYMAGSCLYYTYL